VEEFHFEGDFLTFQDHGDWLPCYEKDAQKLKVLSPLLVYRPYSLENISAFIRACASKKVPVRVRCGGTSLSASSVPSEDGIVLLTSHCKNILEYNSVSGRVWVEPGVTVSQLNHFVQEDGWEFPLEMATTGVAGLGGCLSCHAKGYLQNHFPMYNSMCTIVLIDGKGELLDAPWSLICGSEGIFGVIIRMEIQLSRRIKKKLFLSSCMMFEELMEYLPMIKQHQSLKSIVWNEKDFFFGFEGEEWRLEPAVEALKNLMKPHQMEVTEKIDSSFRFTGKKMSIHLSGALPLRALINGIACMERLAEEMGFESQMSSEVFSGSLQVCLSSSDDLLRFQGKLEKLMVAWIEFLQSHASFPIGSHGIGKLWNNYMTPFINEENLIFLRDLQKTFDPCQIYSQGHFFPEQGKCLIRMAHE